MAVTGFMQTHNILGVYLTYLHAKLSKNKIFVFCFILARDHLDQPCLSHLIWWAQMDLNHRPRAYQARALTN
jgi:hypothetical protein